MNQREKIGLGWLIVCAICFAMTADEITQIFFATFTMISFIIFTYPNQKEG